MALEIFRLMGSVFVNTDDAEKSLKKTDKQAEGLGKKFLSCVGTAAKWGSGIVAAAGAGATALYGVANSAAGAMDVIDKGSAKIGISKKAYQEWGYVLGQNGMDIGKLEVGMKTLVASMDGAAKGTASSKEKFEALGLSIYDAHGKLKDQETMLNETMYALANMENGTEKARLATELFGKAGVEMMPMLNGGADGMTELTNRAHELGLVFGDEAVTAGVVLGDTMDDVKQSLTSVKNKIGVEVMPIIQSGLDWVLVNMPTIQNVCSTVISGIGKGVTLVGGVIQTITNSIKAALNDAGITFGSIMAAAEQMFTNTMNIIKNIWDVIGKPVWDTIMLVVDLAHGYFQERMPAIRDFVKSAFSDIQLIWENNLKPALTAIGDFIRNVLAPAFEFVFKHVIAPAVDAAFNTIGELWRNTLKPVFTGILDFITGVFTLNFKQAFSGLVTAIGGIWDGLKAVVKAPINAVIGMINSFVGGLNRLKVPSWVPGIGGKGINISQIPYLEEGGVLEKGQVGFLEGNGAEAVVPLHNNKKWISAVAEDMGNSGIGGNSDDLKRLLEAFLAFVASLPEILDGTGEKRIVIDKREFARLVKEVG